jgi:ubiquinone/menaquinone biosynthesis C-methylase UbiE
MDERHKGSREAVQVAREVLPPRVDGDREDHGLRRQRGGDLARGGGVEPGARAREDALLPQDVVARATDAALLRGGAAARMTAPTSDRVPQGWDAAADAYERMIAPTTSRYADDALRLADVRAGERVLDVAAGTGAFTWLAAKRGARVLATDFAPAMVERLKARAAREHVAHVEARVMDGQKLDLPDASFDVAGSVFGLIFFPDRVQGFREMRRVLKPGGRAVVATWSEPARVRAVTVLSDPVQKALPELPKPASPPAVFSLRDAKQIEREMTEAGLGDVRIETVTHAFTFPTPESVWRDFAPSSPVFTSLLERLTPEQRERVHARLLSDLRAEFGDGPITLPSEAHVALARRD